MNGVSIGEGNLNNKGVYAERFFRAGDVVIRYSLTPVSDEDLRDLPLGEEMFTHIHHGQRYLYGVPERYVNNSSNPNTYQDIDRQCDVALRDIRPGEAITTDASKDDV